MTDAEGRITFYNEAAARLWGQHPAIGTDKFCGSWKLFWPDGRPLPHSECPMAIALAEKRANRGHEILAERPDGARVSILAFPTPLFDEIGRMTGAVNMLIDTTDRTMLHDAAQRFAAIVDSSDDAILAKDLDGTITSWNRGAELLFGYTADEIVGKPVATLIPADRDDEEPRILSRIRSGERIDHYETVRRRKDGTLVEISLSVSPIRNAQGRIIGASKIARDISGRRRAEEQQRLLLREMDHRVKNLFSLAGSIVSLSRRSATTADELASVVIARLNALAQAHALTVPITSEASPRTTTLHALLRVILAPYDDCSGDKPSRVTIVGADIEVGDAAVTSFALLFHEFATNAAKYGAFSVPDGRVEIRCERTDATFVLIWSERGGPQVIHTEDAAHGFGTLLSRSTVRGQLGGEIFRDWTPEGLSITLSAAIDRLNF